MILLFSGVDAFSQTEFWGMSRNGGAFGYGTIFKTDNKGENPVLIYSFTDTLNGIHPEGSLMQARNKNLYGTTKYGGAMNMGTLFEFNITTNTFLKLHDFDSIESGSYPSGNLIEVWINFLSGMTGYGGVNNLGVMFRYDINSDTIGKLADFDSLTTGGNSENGGLIYSATSTFNSAVITCNPVGGSNNQGVITVYDIYGSPIIQRVDFPHMPDMNNVRGDMIETSLGKFLGLCASGGINLGGYIYEYNQMLNTISIIQNFDTLSGYAPYGKLTRGLNGKFYGLTSSGGSAGTGTLFEFDSYSNTFTHIVDFGSLQTNISNPNGSLMLATNGKLYGMGTAGGICGAVLFEYDVELDSLIEKTDLCSTIGSTSPIYTSLIEIKPDTAITVWPGDCSYNRNVNNADFLYIGVAYLDTGSVRSAASTNYYGQYCNPWATNYIGQSSSGLVNANHADCNGDGIVDTLDAEVILKNYGKTRPLRLSPTEPRSLSHNYLYPLPDRTHVAVGDAVNFEIMMAASSAPMDYTFGLAFTLEFDPHLVDTNRISIDYTNSVIGNTGVDIITFEKDFYSNGLIHLAVVRTDHTDLINVGGLICTLKFYASSSITQASNLKVSTANIKAIRATGASIELHPLADSVTIDPNLVQIKSLSFSNQLDMFPNPVVDKLTIRSLNETIQSIDIYNTAGKNVRSIVARNNETSFSVKDLAAGVYLTRVITEDHVYNQLVRVIR